MPKIESLKPWPAVVVAPPPPEIRYLAKNKLAALLVENKSSTISPRDVFEEGRKRKKSLAVYLVNKS